MSELAYLVIREGSKWTDVFRLIPGQSVTIGRAPTNQIVIKDERCSRNHAEVFFSERAMDAARPGKPQRHGGREQLLAGDQVLQPGDMIRIGHSQLVFVHNLAKAFPDSSAIVRSGRRGEADGNGPAAVADDDASVLADYEPRRSPIARARRGFSKPRKAKGPGLQDRPGGGQALPAGFRAGQGARRRPAGGDGPGRTVREAPRSTPAPCCCCPATSRDRRRPTSWKSSPRAVPTHPYHRVPNFLAATVLREGEAVLARNVMGDSTLGSRDSKGEIHATSVLCAPVRRGTQGPRAGPSLLDRSRDACPIPTIWNSPWPWPTPWPWPWRISVAARSWPKT